MTKPKTKIDVVPTTIQISLPDDQIKLLEYVRELLSQLVDSQTNSHYVTEKQAAASLGISYSLMQRWRKDGIFRYRQYGQVIRYQVKELFEDFDSASTVPATNKKPEKIVEILKKASKNRI